MEKIPEKIFHPTRFDGYYVTEDGEIWTEWHVKYIKGQGGSTSVRGDLRKLNQFPRGGVNPDDRYLSINISLKDENGRTSKQIRYYSHRLIAETLIDNPNDLKEIDHIDRNKTNNHINNLRWVTREENMEWNAKKFKVYDEITDQHYEGVNNVKWVKENWEWISKRTKSSLPNYVKRLNYRKKCCGLVLTVL